MKPLPGLRKFFGRMDLDAERGVDVKELHEQGEFIAEASVALLPHQTALLAGHQLVDIHAFVGPFSDHGKALRISGKHPEFGAPDHGAQDRFEFIHQISGSAVIAAGWGIPISFRMVGATLQRAPSLTLFTSSPAPMTMNCTRLREWAVLGLPSSLTA